MKSKWPFYTDKFNILRQQKNALDNNQRTIDASSAGRNENGNESQPSKFLSRTGRKSFTLKFIFWSIARVVKIEDEEDYKNSIFMRIFLLGLCERTTRILKMAYKQHKHASDTIIYSGCLPSSFILTYTFFFHATYKCL